MATTYTPILLSGSEPFTHDGQPIGYSMEDFWRFQFSNIWEMQEEVAEFLVAKALGQELPYNKNGWTLWDITYGKKRVEVKTSSYYHSWRIDGKVSDIRTFSIAPAYTRYKDPTSELKRQNDVYVFCLNLGTDQESSHPLHLENWRFWVVPTSLINKHCGLQKKITLGRVKKLSGNQEGLTYDEIKATIDAMGECGN